MQARVFIFPEDTFLTAPDWSPHARLIVVLCPPERTSEITKRLGMYLSVSEGINIRGCKPLAALKAPCAPDQSALPAALANPEPPAQPTTLEPSQPSASPAPPATSTTATTPPPPAMSPVGYYAAANYYASYYAPPGMSSWVDYYGQVHYYTPTAASVPYLPYGASAPPAAAPTPAAATPIETLHSALEMIDARKAALTSAAPPAGSKAVPDADEAAEAETTSSSLPNEASVAVGAASSSVGDDAGEAKGDDVKGGEEKDVGEVVMGEDADETRDRERPAAGLPWEDLNNSDGESCDDMEDDVEDVDMAARDATEVADAGGTNGIPILSVETGNHGERERAPAAHTPEADVVVLQSAPTPSPKAHTQTFDAAAPTAGDAAAGAKGAASVERRGELASTMDMAVEAGRAAFLAKHIAEAAERVSPWHCFMRGSDQGYAEGYALGHADAARDAEVSAAAAAARSARQLEDERDHEVCMSSHLCHLHTAHARTTPQPLPLI